MTDDGVNREGGLLEQDLPGARSGWGVVCNFGVISETSTLSEDSFHGSLPPGASAPCKLACVVPLIREELCTPEILQN